MCSIIGVGERLHKVLGQIDLAYWTQVSDRCPLGYLLGNVALKRHDFGFTNCDVFMDVNT